MSSYQDQIYATKFYFVNNQYLFYQSEYSRLLRTKNVKDIVKMIEKMYLWQEELEKVQKYLKNIKKDSLQVDKETFTDGSANLLINHNTIQQRTDIIEEKIIQLLKGINIFA